MAGALLLIYLCLVALPGGNPPKPSLSADFQRHHPLAACEQAPPLHGPASFQGLPSLGLEPPIGEWASQNVCHPTSRPNQWSTRPERLATSVVGQRSARWSRASASEPFSTAVPPPPPPWPRDGPRPAGQQACVGWLGSSQAACVHFSGHPTANSVTTAQRPLPFYIKHHEADPSASTPVFWGEAVPGSGLAPAPRRGPGLGLPPGLLTEGEHRRGTGPQKRRSLSLSLPDPRGFFKGGWKW